MYHAAVGPGGTELPQILRDERTGSDDALHDLAKVLSDYEFAQITFSFGFLRWVEKCMEATGLRGLTALDILVLHAVNIRARGRRLSEISMLLNIDDSHLVAYSLKKLVSAELVQSIKDGRESRYEPTVAGDAACDTYRSVRRDFLVKSIASIANAEAEAANMAHFLTILTGMYDQATRLATASSSHLLQRPPVRTKR